MQYMLTKKNMALNIIQALYQIKERDRLLGTTERKRHFNRLMTWSKKDLTSQHERAIKVIQKTMVN
jgi:dynactin complex subunit